MAFRSGTIGVATVRHWATSLPKGAAVLDIGCGLGVPISEAAQWSAQAAEVATSLPDGGGVHRVRAVVRRADALRLAGDPDQEAALFGAAGEALALGEPELVGDAAFALLQLGATTETGSLHERAIDVAHAALDLVTDQELWARVAAAASLTHSMTGHPDLCRDLFVQAERTAVSSETAPRGPALRLPRARAPCRPRVPGAHHRRAARARCRGERRSGPVRGRAAGVLERVAAG